MRKHSQQTGLQEAIRSGAQTHTIVVVALNADTVPVLFEVERHDFERNQSQLYTMVHTRKAPKQWFLMWESFGAAPPDRRLASDFSDYTSYGESVSNSPLRSIWIAPHLHIDATIPELAEIELLTELPEAYALDGHLQSIIAGAYDGYFLWCEQCNDWESCESRVHNRHIELALDENAFYCQRCQRYRKCCSHYASAEAFWASLRTT